MSRAIVVVVWSGLLVVSVFLSLLVWSCRLLLSLLVWYSCLVMGGRLHRPPPVGRTYFFASILSYPILSYPILSYPILSYPIPSSSFFLVPYFWHISRSVPSRTFGISHVLVLSCLVVLCPVLYIKSRLVSRSVPSSLVPHFGHISGSVPSCLVVSVFFLVFLVFFFFVPPHTLWQVSSRVMSRRLLSRTLGISRVLSRPVPSRPRSFFLSYSVPSPPVLLAYLGFCPVPVFFVLFSLLVPHFMASLLFLVGLGNGGGFAAPTGLAPNRARLVSSSSWSSWSSWSSFLSCFLSILSCLISYTLGTLSRPVPFRYVTFVLIFLTSPTLRSYSILVFFIK